MTNIRTISRAGAVGAASLLLAAGAAGAAYATQSRALASTWSGTWKIPDAGTLVTAKFTQSGNSVTGTYGTGTFTGTASGSTLTGIARWDIEGPIIDVSCVYWKTTFAADGKSFAGYTGQQVYGMPNSPPTCPPVAETGYHLALTGTCVSGGCLGNSGAATKPAVLGTWEYLGGAVRVTATGTGFAGVVLKKTTERCSRPIGQHIWTIAPNGAAYSGTHLAYTSACKPIAVRATFTITQKQSAFALKLCTGNACTTHKRLKPPA